MMGAGFQPPRKPLLGRTKAEAKPSSPAPAVPSKDWPSQRPQPERRRLLLPLADFQGEV